jgi:hypothetical protein
MIIKLAGPCRDCINLREIQIENAGRIEKISSYNIDTY